MHPANTIAISDTTNPAPTVQQGQTGPIQSIVGGLGDYLTGEIENIIGKIENSIMQGIQDELNNLLSNALSQLLDVSPISAVNSL